MHKKFVVMDPSAVPVPLTEIQSKIKQDEPDAC